MRLLKTSASDGGRRLARATTGAGEVGSDEAKVHQRQRDREGATGRRPAVGAATMSVLAALMVWVVALPAEHTAVLAVGARPSASQRDRR